MTATFRSQHPRWGRLSNKERKLPRNWPFITRTVIGRTRRFRAESAHQHGLIDQASHYLDHLLEQYFPLSKTSELDYLTAATPFQTYEAGEFIEPPESREDLQYIALSTRGSLHGYGSAGPLTLVCTKERSLE